jgi:apolipoprotein D and lipocalin family protein
MKIRRILLLLITAAASVGCTGVPEGIEPVTGFELDRYLGNWYEIARLDHRFERGLSNVTATYSRRPEGGVRVVNRGYNDDTGEWEQAAGKAFFVGQPTVGRLKVSFFGPFYGAYNIIELDKDGYRYSMVTGPDRSYLWILSRTPELEPSVLERLVARAAGLHFETAELIYVDHSMAGPER